MIEAWGRANDPVGYRDYVAAGGQFDREEPARDTHIENAIIFKRWSTMHDLLRYNDVDPYAEESGTAQLVMLVAQATDRETAHRVLLVAAARSVGAFEVQGGVRHKQADDNQEVSAAIRLATAAAPREESHGPSSAGWSADSRAAGPAPGTPHPELPGRAAFGRSR